MFLGLSEEDARLLQEKLDTFYTIMDQELQVLQDQAQREKVKKEVESGEGISDQTTSYPQALSFQQGDHINRNLALPMDPKVIDS